MKKSRTALQNLYGTTGTIFPDNTTRLISEGDERDFGQDTTDSAFNLIDDLYSGAGGVKPPIVGPDDLRAIVTVGLPYGVHVIFRSDDENNILRVYKLVNSTDAETAPNIIRPTDYDGATNHKVWKLAALDAYIIQDTVDTTGSTITFDFLGATARQFVGSNLIGAAKLWVFNNDENAKQFSFTFTTLNDIPQELPSDFLMSDARFEVGVWTPNEGDLGRYKATAIRDLVMDKWLLTIEGPFSSGITT